MYQYLSRSFPFQDEEDSSKETEELNGKRKENEHNEVPVPKRSLRCRKPLGPCQGEFSASKSRWTEEEKSLLLRGLRIHGYTGSNFKQIAQEIPTRSPLEVASCLKYWKRTACMESVKSARNAKSRCNLETKMNLKKARSGEKPISDQLAHIEAWIDHFAKKIPNTNYKGCGDSEGVYALSHVLMVIAKLEAHPDPAEADGLDFK